MSEVHAHGATAPLLGELILAAPFFLAAAVYLVGVVTQSARGRPWPWWRTTAWLSGVAAAASGFVGPLAARVHDDFVAHMWSHVVTGMVAPLLLVVAAPVTLALRSLHVSRARRVSRLLNSRPVRIVSTPLVAAVLSTGGLAVLYATPLFEIMRESRMVHLAVMTHVLFAGVLFIAAIIPVDPSPHRAGLRTRMSVLVLSLAAHNVIAKTLYASPPSGVGSAQGEAGSMLMYYAGDVVDAVIIAVLCVQWYRAGGRELRRASAAVL